jgi:hypothetical protein
MDYVDAEMYSIRAGFRKAQLNGMVYERPVRKPWPVRNWFRLHRSRPSAPRYIPAAGNR